MSSCAAAVRLAVGVRWFAQLCYSSAWLAPRACLLGTVCIFLKARLIVLCQLVSELLAPLLSHVVCPCSHFVCTILCAQLNCQLNCHRMCLSSAQRAASICGGQRLRRVCRLTRACSAEPHAVLSVCRLIVTALGCCLLQHNSAALLLVAHSLHCLVVCNWYCHCDLRSRSPHSSMPLWVTGSRCSSVQGYR